jgi:LacI family transcriptional regulator
MRMRTVGSKRVVILTSGDDGFSREIIRGVARYAKGPGWKILLRSSVPSPWECIDGVLAILHDKRQLRALRKLGVPLVSVSGLIDAGSTPQVLGDDRAVARLAAEEFGQRGFVRFGYVGNDRLRPSRTRQQAFVEAVGGKCGIWNRPGPAGDSAESTASLARWLGQRQRPIAILAFNDVMGLQVTEAAAMRGLHVPADVAVLGVDDDEVICELSSPSLSSIYPNTLRRGHRAAALLESLLSGQGPPPGPILVAPRGITLRASSDTLAFKDPDLRAALCFILTSATASIDVEQVMDHVSCSRRTLEKRFLEHLGCTPSRQILRVRMSKARWWLAESDLSVTQIAMRCGSASVSAFTQSFRRHTGLSPSQYRKQSALSPGHRD